MHRDFRIEHQFCSIAGEADGTAPMGEIAFHGDTAFGTAKGSDNNGNSQVVWWISPATGFGNLSASSTYGWAAFGGLAVAPGVGLVGVTNKGDTNGRGAYFTVIPNTAVPTLTRMWPFPASRDNPNVNIDTPAIQVPTISSRGAIVIAKQLGGVHGTGTIVELGSQAVLKDFDDLATRNGPNATGALPNGRLLEGPDRLLYGTTMYGGANGTGVIYRIARDGVGFEVLHNFGPGQAPDGSALPARSYGGLTLASNGMFYGATWRGKTLFNFDPPPAVPDVRGDTPAVARQVLAAAGLAVGKVTIAPHILTCHVVSQNPKPGPAPLPQPLKPMKPTVDLVIGRALIPCR